MEIQHRLDLTFKVVTALLSINLTEDKFREHCFWPEFLLVPLSGSVYAENSDKIRNQDLKVCSYKKYVDRKSVV